MKSETLTASVIVPVYNGEKFLAETLQSIERQTTPPLEIIIVDDGSTDGTASIAAGFGALVRYVYQANRGPAAARNRGLELARGDVICFCDADDLWLENTIEIQLVQLRNNPTADIVIGQLQLFRQTGEVDGKPHFETFPLPLGYAHLGSMAIRKSVVDRIGGLDDTVLDGEDWELLLRARSQGISFLFHPHVVLLYRQHDQSRTRQRSLDKQVLPKMLKQVLARRRRESHQEVLSLPLPSRIEESTAHAEHPNAEKAPS
jgi:glycosyltransferase involved in cell wall biosynthesis